MFTATAVEVVGGAFRRVVKILPIGNYYIVRFAGIRTAEGLVILTDPPTGPTRRLRGKLVSLDVGYFSSLVKAYVFLDEVAYLVGVNRLDQSASALTTQEPSFVQWTVDYGRQVEPSSTAEAFVPLLAELEYADTEERLRISIVSAQSAAVRADRLDLMPDADVEHVLAAALARSDKDQPDESNAMSDTSIPLIVDYSALASIPVASEDDIGSIVAPSAAVGPYRVVVQEITKRGMTGRAYVLIAQMETGEGITASKGLSKIMDGLLANQAQPVV